MTTTTAPTLQQLALSDAQAHRATAIAYQSAGNPYMANVYWNFAAQATARATR